MNRVPDLGGVPSLARLGRPAVALHVSSRVSPSGWLAPSHAASAATLSLAEQIADRIAGAIVHGDYAPGQRLQEQSIAVAFQVSRGPVRDALRILEREGLVVIQARRGASVQQLSLKDVKEIFEVRAGLYGLAAEAISVRGDVATVAALKKSVNELRAALALDDPLRFLDAIYVKSMDIADACGNDLLRSLIYSQGRQTLALTQRVMIVRANQERWYTNWRSLVRAIVAREAGKADAAGRALVRDVEAMVLALFDNGASAGEGGTWSTTRRTA